MANDEELFELGETTDEYVDRRGDDDEVWIKGFKEGNTRFRILQPTAKWVTYREHFDDGVGYFPCVADFGDPSCVGCNDPSEKVRNRSRRFAFNALDEQGRLNVYKLGARSKRVFEGREQRIGSVTDRDYVIYRSGKGLDTTYDIEAGDKYAVTFDGDLHNIKALLGAKYLRVKAAYEGTDTEPVADTDGLSEPAVDQPIDMSDPGNEPEPGQNGKPDFEEMSTADIKAWIKKNLPGVEPPARAPRSKLVAIASGEAPF